MSKRFLEKINASLICLMHVRELVVKPAILVRLKQQPPQVIILNLGIILGS